jgi:adenylylsulfate kinase-like enzyme
MPNLKKKKIKGIWLYGLSGSGKTYASAYLKKKIKKTFIIDGDYIRKEISKDLSYTNIDRTKQINRMLSIGKLSIKNDTFPLISTVWMTKEVFKKAIKNKVLVIEIIRENFEIIKKNHKTYKNKKNVVGKNFHLAKIKSKKLINTGNNLFKNELKKLL